MSETPVSGPAPALMLEPPPPFLLRLYNHNPFYVISALLMLFAVRNAYGVQEIGSINCWLMLGVLGAYTALLGLIGVLIVRWGRVWEDARSIFVVVLLLFLATSVSADDLFVKMESGTGGLLLLAGCYVFSALVTEGVFRGAGIRLGWLYRVPYHLLMALFFLAPWWVSPELHPRSRSQMEWLIVAFPAASAVLVLTLLPAVRRGVKYLSNNGTPWPWPLFPWIGFGVLIVAHTLRSFAMCMTFGPRGPIWITVPSSSSSSGERVFINYDTMWGPYFLVPIAFAVLILMLESGLVSGNRIVQRRVMAMTPFLLLMAVPLSTGPVHIEFLEKLTANVASPVWLTLVLVWLIYGRAWAAGVRYADAGLLAATLLFSVVGPSTLGAATMTPVQSWPWLLTGMVLFVSSVARSSMRQAVGAALFTFGLWQLLPSTAAAGLRNTISLHVLWGGVMAIGFTTRDRTAAWLRRVGAMMFPLAAVAMLSGPAAVEVPLLWKVMYVGLLAMIAARIAWVMRSRAYHLALISVGAVSAYELAAIGYRGSASLFGRAAMTSFLWSLGLLLVGLLISAHKARWLPPGLVALFSPGAEKAEGDLGRDAGGGDAGVRSGGA